MKRNKLFTLALAACATLLAACSTELDTSGNPDRAGAGEAIVAVSLHFPGADTPAGYADVPTGVALDLEKEIKSIAFIAFTQGGTGVYLSTNPTLDDRGLTKPLTPVEGQPTGNYTAQFKIKSADLSGKTTLVAIANFEEHGLTFDNTDDLTIASLRAMLTQALKADGAIEYPLLMTLAQELELVEGSVVTVPFEMERIVARVDVLNSAYDKANPTNRFVLTSARLLSAPTQGTMIGGELIAAPTYVDLEVQDEVNEVAPPEGDLLTPVKQQLAPMYVYENTNADKDDATKLSATATSVELKGTYKGKEYHKIIPFVTAKKVVGGALTGDEIVPIVRNYRYVVEILSSDENTLDFVLKATDWVDGQELDVKVDMEAPKVESLTWSSADVAWNEGTLIADITGAVGDIELRFTARGVRATDIAVEAVYDENPDKLINHITVDKRDLTGYADDTKEGLSRSYTVKIPTRTGEFPVGFNVIVFNEKAKTVIHVKHTPLFVTDWKSSQTQAMIDPAAQLIDLRNVPLGDTGTLSFFATSSSDLTTTIANKGITPDFYAITTTADETDPALLAKYGPGKRVTLSYKAISEKTEFAEVKVTDAGGDATAKKAFVKCFKKPYALTTNVSPTPANALLEGTDKLYLAVNNGNHGTIDYTVYNDATNPSDIIPTAIYETSITSPDWVKEGVVITQNEVKETFSEFNIVKSTVSISLPTTIKNPAAVTSFTLGITSDAAIQLIPVYPSGSTITEADKAFRPVLVKGIWWSPINIGQTKISEVGDPTSVGGNLFQWGRKQALTLNTPIRDGAVELGDPLIDQDYFIRTASGRDWLKTSNDKLWHEGDETTPRKTSSDPCPAGWRIPTLAEANQSISGTYRYESVSSPSANSNARLTIGGESGAKLYFPAMGNFNEHKQLEMVGNYGHYWLSTVYDSSSGLAMLFNNQTFRGPAGKARSKAMPLRCVQE